METDDYLDALRRDAGALLSAARAADPTTQIAGCPEWSTIDLVWHIGVVHRFWCTVVAERLQERPAEWPPERPAADLDVFAFAEESATLLPAALAGADPSEIVWTWAPRKDVGFVQRRMAQETAVHRVDAERAAGVDHRLDAELAADGIDEFLTLMLPADIGGALPEGTSVHLHCTDTDRGGEWTVTRDSTGAPVVAADHTKADTALRGSAHDLLMVLWQRDDLGHVEVLGDRELAGRFVALDDA